MWHRVQGWDILESVASLPPDLEGKLEAFLDSKGWLKSVEPPAPYFNPDTQMLIKVYTYDQIRRTVTEAWSVIPLAETSQNELDAQAARAYPKLAALRSMTPAEIGAWVDANVTDFASAKDAIKTLAIAVSLLSRRI